MVISTILASLLFPLAIFEAPLTAAAIAGGAVSIPIIIHLLNRRRYKIVPWAAMRFLLAAQKKNSRRMRLEQWLLLLVRCLLLVLLLGGMVSVTPWAESLWRWLMPNAVVAMTATTSRTHKILVIDGSYSMAGRVGDSTAFEKARERAIQAVRKSPRGHGISVVLCGSPPQRIVPEPSEDHTRVIAELEALRLPHGNGDLAATFSTIEGLLQSSPEKYPEKEVLFFTDLQKTTWLAGQPPSLTPTLKRARTVLIDTAEQDQPNVAVTAIGLRDDIAIADRDCIITATLRNYSTESKADFPVKLLLRRAQATAADPAGETIQLDTTLRLDRNQENQVYFKVRFPAPGDYSVQAQIPGDRLPVDDVRSTVITVRKQLKVLLVNGKPFGDLFDQSTEWLRLALNPFAEGGDSGSIVRPKVITATAFSDETQGDLNPYDCVFLCDVPSLTPAESRRLEGFVRRGGGVVFCLGSQVQPGEYNRVLFRDGAGLLPVPLIGPLAAGKPFEYHLALESDSEQLKPIKEFQSDDDRTSLLAPRFARFYQTGNPPPGVRPRRILSFVAGPIAGKETEAKAVPNTPRGGAGILEWNPPAPAERGGATNSNLLSTRTRGKVLVVAAPVNSDWSNWPASPSFPALMQELLYFACSGRLQGYSSEVGQPLELFLPGAASVETMVQTPDDRKDTVKTQLLEDGTLLRWADNDISGLYRVKVGREPREYLFAVNPPAYSSNRKDSESDLTRATPDELFKAYSELELQIVKDLARIDHTPRNTPAPQEPVYQPLGPEIAHYLMMVVLGLLLFEVILAFIFGHYNPSRMGEEGHLLAQQSPTTFPIRLLRALPYLFFLLGLLVLGVLVYESFTGDFLGFLPDSFRSGLERLAGIPAPASGEARHWRLENGLHFFSDRTDPWMTGGVLLAGAALIYLIYSREGHRPTWLQRLVLMGLRLEMLLLVVGILLPQSRLVFERQGWPEVVLLIDDSQSMSAREHYAEPEMRDAADVLARDSSRLAAEKRLLARKLEERSKEREEASQKRTPDDVEHLRLQAEARQLADQAHQLDVEADELDRARDGSDLQRLHLLQVLATRDDLHWVRHLVEQRKVRLHVYHCSSRTSRQTVVSSPDQLSEVVTSINSLVASPQNDSSQLGNAVHQVINDFRGSSLAAILMLTDGVTTDGEDLKSAGNHARQMGVPLYFVGVGDAHEVRDIYLHGLQVRDSVYVNDRLIFELKITGQGFANKSVEVTLSEKGKNDILDRQTVQLDPQGKAVNVRLAHQPREPGEKIYEIKTPVQEGEVDRDNNRIEKVVSVNETKLIKVLYVEGYRRYEYHFLKTLLERESARLKGNKTVELKVFLMDADPGFIVSDRSAIGEFPTRKELDAFDVVILGDVDPKAPRMNEHLKDLADFVKERGGGLLMIAGERHAPQDFADSPLKDVLPIDWSADKPRPAEDVAALIQDGYRPEFTPSGRVHSMFRFLPEEKENNDVLDNLKPMYWFARGYLPKRAAEVLAVHPSIKREDRKAGNAADTEKEGVFTDQHALVLQQFIGAGRCMFFGFSETWRWGHREEQVHYNHFWIETIRYLARSRIGRIELKLDRQTNYRRGEPIKVLVRFPDDAQPPAADTEVKVVVERKIPDRVGDREIRTISLARIEGSRSAFEAILTQTPEGDYAFWLSVPAVADPKPRAECKVVAPPGEMYGLRMNRNDMETAAEESHGGFYTLANADRLLQDLQVGNRVTVSSSGQPFNLWNHPLLYLAALLILTTEWLLRKLVNLV